MAESQDYYRGKVDAIQALTWSRCKLCGAGYSRTEKSAEGYVHVIGVDGDERPLCECQQEQHHIHLAEQDARHAYLDERYGGMWHHSYTLKNRLLHKKCYCCHERPTRRIDFNCWGSVSELDVCDEHAQQYDGKCGDSVTSREEADKMAANSRA